MIIFRKNQFGELKQSLTRHENGGTRPWIRFRRKLLPLLYSVLRKQNVTAFSQLFLNKMTLANYIHTIQSMGME